MPKRFEDIIVWKKAIELAEKIYRVFKNCKDFGFKDQIQRASVSISNNIAEGYEKSSSKDFGKFLYIAKGSCGEVRSMLYLALTFSYITQNEFTMLMEETTTISKMLAGFIKATNT